MFITAVCVIFLIKLRWPKNKSLNRLNWMLRAGTDENVCVCGGGGGGGGGGLMFIRLFTCFRGGPGEAEFVQLYHMQQSNPLHVLCINISGSHSHIYNCT